MKFSKGIYSLEWVSAKGKNDDAGTGGISEEFLKQKGYVTQDWVNSQGFLKSVNWGLIANKPSWITDSKPSWWDATSHPTTLAGYGITDALTATTANSTYVKKSGDTMTGDLTLPGYLYLSRAGFNYINTTHENGTIAFISGGGKENSQANSSLVINNANQVYPGLTEIISLGTSNLRWSNVYANTINVSSNELVSNLNADLLDGLHQTAFMRWSGTSISNDSDVSNINRLAGYLLKSNEMVNVPANGPFIGFGSSNYYRIIQGDYGGDALRVKRYSNGTFGEWKTFAFTDSNVLSASQLQTSRNIWGQPFNGTAPVDGLFRALIQGVPASGIGTVAHKILSYQTYPYGLITYINNVGASLIQSQREAGSEYFALCLNPLGGNVGVGLNNPSYNFQVTGTFYASGATTLASTLSVSGTSTMRSILPYSNLNYALGSSSYKWTELYTNGIVADEYVKIGGCTLIWDGTALKCDKGFYSESFISCKGVNTSSNGTVGGAYLPVTGGTITGDLTINGNITSKGDVLLGSFSSDNVSLIGNDIFLTADWTLNLSAKESVNINGPIALNNGIQSKGVIRTLIPDTPENGYGTIVNKTLIYSVSPAGIVTSINASGVAMIQSQREVSNTETFPLCLNPRGGAVGIGTNNPSSTYKLYVAGTLGVTGAVSQNISDLRLKTDIDTDVDCLEILLKLGNVFRYRYNGLAVSGRNWLDTTTLHTGIAYQNAVKAMIPDFTGTDEQGYGYVNFLSSDYQATLLGGLIRTALLQKAMQNDVNSLKERIRQLEERVAELERA